MPVVGAFSDVRSSHFCLIIIFLKYSDHWYVGVELGGALKNVLAIACGICDGLEYGNNARAGLITRGNAQ